MANIFILSYWWSDRPSQVTREMFDTRAQAETVAAAYTAEEIKRIALFEPHTALTFETAVTEYAPIDGKDGGR